MGRSPKPFNARAVEILPEGRRSAMTIHSQALIGGFFAMLTLAVILFVLVSAGVVIAALCRVVSGRLRKAWATRRQTSDLGSEEWLKDFG